MLLTSSWFPTRIPVSLVLLPIFWLVLAISPNLHQWRSLWVLIIVYGFLFAAVNGFNNYFNSENRASSRPKIINVVAISLYLLAITFSYVKVSALFAVLIGAYGIVAVTYNDPLISWNKYLLLRWALSGFIHGIFTFVLLYIGVNKFSLASIDQPKVYLPGLFISLVLWAFYPIIFKLKTRQPLQLRKISSLVQHRLFLLTLELLTIAIVFTGFYFKNYIAWIYFPPLLVFYFAGVLFLYFKLQPTETRYLHAFGWISILGLNGFAFYLFTHYTNILQLI